MFGGGGLVTQLCPTLCDPIRLLCPWDFPRQEYWSGLPFSPSWDIPDLGIEPVSPALAGGFFTTEPPGKLLYMCMGDQIKPRQEQNLILQQVPG